jgi:hypothetical protein
VIEVLSAKAVAAVLHCPDLFDPNDPLKIFNLLKSVLLDVKKMLEKALYIDPELKTTACALK